MPELPSGDDCRLLLDLAVRIVAHPIVPTGVYQAVRALQLLSRGLELTGGLKYSLVSYLPEADPLEQQNIRDAVVLVEQLLGAPR